MSGLFGALILVLGVISCGGGDGTIAPSPTCPANTICLESQTFFPSTLSVQAGTTVIFENDLAIFHNIVFDTPAAAGAGDGTGNIADASATHTRKFATAGTYGFHCTVHPATMNGILTVTP